MKIVKFKEREPIKQPPQMYECECSSRIFHLHDDGTVTCALCADYIGLAVAEIIDNGST